MQDNNTIDILQEALTLGKLLAASGIAWAFAGGIAVGIHGYIRATEDVDIVIDPQCLDKLDRVLKENDYIIGKDPIPFKDGFSVHRRVKIAGSDYFVLDVMIPPPGFNSLLDNRVEGRIDGFPVYVVSRQDLIEMKKLAGRSKDLADIAELEKSDE
jgi:predicted nucleotidyltransferase